MNPELEKALAFHKSGQLNKAEKIYLNILSNNQRDSGLLQLLGTLYLQKKNFNLSREYLLKSYNINSNNPATLNNLGNLEKTIGNYSEANKYFKLNIDKNNFLSSWINKSNLLIQQEEFDDCLNFVKLAIQQYPNDKKLKNNYAISLFNCGFKKECLDIYRDFDKNNSHFSESLINYSKVLFQLKLYDESLKVINTLLFSNNNHIDALTQRYLIYRDLKKYSKAEEDLLAAYNFDKTNLLTNQMLVDFLMFLKKYSNAIYHCNLMLDANVENNFFLARRIVSKIYLGNWNNFDNDLQLLNENKEKLSFSPLDIKYISDDANLQKKIAENYWLQKKSKINYLPKISNKNTTTKNNKIIRIGYFSGDFRNHAVFNLIQDLFVNHNKSIFEIYCYSSYKKEGSERNKVIKFVDYFFDIDEKSDEEILNLVTSHNLDIAIDLSGYTLHSKSELFEFDIAKIKINYLGYPGTMGTESYDYIVADKYIIPPDHEEFYSEKILYLSENYQPFSPIPFETKIDRSSFNLPEDGFILGCLSRIEKILPNIFNIWMQILNKFNDTYLALYISNDEIKENIKNYCKKNNFDFNRIIFLNHINHKENLKRISTFDLYLDTFPYNGHTAISDSLFQSCVPTITLVGNSFASRVSSSLINTLKLNELITKNENEYFEKIDYFCSNRDNLKIIKNKLLNYKKNNLDRMKTFTKDFEKQMLSLIG